VNTATREQKRSASREIIRKEALLLAEEFGWEKLTVRALSDRIGYAPPILYRYYDNKAHLLNDLVAMGFDRLNASMERAAESLGTPGEKLVRAARARFKFAVKYKALHSLMFGAGGPCRRFESGLNICRAEALVTSLLCRIASGNTSKAHCKSGHALLVNFIALIKGYTYFAAEMPAPSARAAFFGPLNPEDALAKAMERFISSIQPIDHE